MKRFLLFSLCVALSACSVTQVQVHHHWKQQTAEISRSLGTTCHQFTLPDAIQVPAIPLQDFGNLKAAEHEKRIHLLIDYIEQLRLHISESKKQLNRHYREYLTECSTE